MSDKTVIASEVQPVRSKRLMASGFVTSLLLISFASGVAIGAWQIPPYQTLKAIWDSRPWGDQISSETGEQGEVNDFDWEADVMQSAFADNPSIDGELYFPPITDVPGIRQANERAFVETERLENAFEEIEVKAAEQLNLPSGSLPVVRVTYTYHGQVREAFSYGNLPSLCHGGRGSLILPGSGENQASAIFNGDSDNYHYGILNVVSDEPPDVRFVFIKQNHDFLAWHNGQGGKLRGDIVFAWQLNRGGSYSVSYLSDAIAFSKWMESCFNETAILGLSQGGAAALLVSLQARPSYSIVASGHSLLFQEALESGIDQIIGVPGYFELFREDILVGRVQSSPTKWFFSWGKDEPGLYGHEARGGTTYKALSGLDNVIVSGHDGGHEFPLPELEDFLGDE